MTTNSSISKVPSKVYLLATLALCVGYYGGQLVLWIMGLKGVPKFGAAQLFNTALIFMLGYPLIKWLAVTSKPVQQCVMIIAATTIIRYLIVCFTDGGDYSWLFIFRRNLIEIFTFGLMASTGVICGYFTYKKLT